MQERSICVIKYVGWNEVTFFAFNVLIIPRVQGELKQIQNRIQKYCVIGERSIRRVEKIFTSFYKCEHSLNFQISGTYNARSIKKFYKISENVCCILS